MWLERRRRRGSHRDRSSCAASAQLVRHACCLIRKAGTITRVICEYQSYAEEHIMRIIQAILFQGVEGRMEEIDRTMGSVLREAATIEQRLTTSEWLVGENFSAADIIVFPGIQMLLRSLERREAQELRARFLPLESNFPAIAAWVGRVQSLPGYGKTVPPHWKE